MGDLNLDLTTNKRFLIIPYACAAIGAVAGVATTAAVTLPGIIAAGAMGAVAGGIGLPVAGSFAMFAGISVATILKSGVGGLKGEVTTLPLLAGVVAISCAKALFVTPFQAIAKGVGAMKIAARKKEMTARRPPPDDSSNIGKRTARTEFDKVAANVAEEPEKTPASQTPSSKPGQQP